MKFNIKFLAAACLFGNLAVLCACSQNAQTSEPKILSQAAPPAEHATAYAEVKAAADLGLIKLEEINAAGRSFTAADQPWLDSLNKVLGAEEIELPDLNSLPNTRRVNCRLRWDSLNKIDNSARLLHKTLKTMKAAQELRFKDFVLPDGSKIPVCNQTVFGLMRQSYTPDDLCKARDLLKEKGVFNIRVNPKNGLAATCDIEEGENDNMSKRQWVTDTVWAGGLEMQESPRDWIKAVETLAKFYTGPAEQKAFDEIIADPQIYLQGGPETGVAHIFDPDTLERDPGWLNNKRLESMGMALGALTGLLVDGFVMHTDRGTPDPKPEVLAAIANLTAYLAAIDYPYAPSAGNWEEIPFPGGLTWDTAAINTSLTELYNFMYNHAYDKLPGMDNIRHRLMAQKHGQVFKNRKSLEKLLERGKKRVAETYMAESPGHREIDSSLAFVGAEGHTFLDPDPVKNAEKHLQVLDMLEKSIVRDHGMIRYAPFTLKLKDGSEVKSPDSYLNLNYNIACDIYGRLNMPWFMTVNKFGSFDASDPLVFTARSKMSSPDCEAQWFMVSDLARSYSMCFRNLFNSAKERSLKEKLPKVELNSKEVELIKLARAGADRNLNRALARITPERESVKANGEKCPAWAVPEAWQCVSTLDGRKAWLPGVNTPLTWAKTSLNLTLNYHSDNLTRLEENGLTELTAPGK